MENMIHLDGTQLKQELKELVRGSVEETLNQLLDAKADRITQARRSVLSDIDRQDLFANKIHSNANFCLIFRRRSCYKV
jgi:hypothetical protein